MESTVIDIEQIISPLEGDNPAGVSVRYDDDYEIITQEIAKLSAIKPEPVNWAKVVELSSTILKQKSKDLLIASYLSYGLFEVHGYKGLDAGLLVFYGLINNFWDILFPEKRRLRGRLAAASWLMEKLEKVASARKPSKVEEEAIVLALKDVERLGALLEEKFAGEAPPVSPLVRALRGYSDEFDAHRRKNEVQSVQAAAAKATGLAEITSDADVSKALRQCQGMLKKIIAS